MILLHCSAGIGRTGTFAATIEALRCAKKYGKISIFEIVDNMRKDRFGCVQKR
jgi:protein tyrosine phosphatase